MPSLRPRVLRRSRDDGAEGAAGADKPLTGFVDLLAAMQCQTAAELDLMLYTAFDLDPCVIEAGPHHIVVAIRSQSVEVRFPCTLQEFWDSVAQLERDAAPRLEDAPDDR